jgi:DnaJ-class molecular chaperone
MDGLMSTTTIAATAAETRAALVALAGTCPTCRGQGVVWSAKPTHDTGYGSTSTLVPSTITTMTVCPTCGGESNPDGPF